MLPLIAAPTSILCNNLDPNKADAVPTPSLNAKAIWKDVLASECKHKARSKQGTSRCCN